MSAAAQHGNVRAIRPGIVIPEPTTERPRASVIATLASSWLDKAHCLAQTEPNSERHRTALHMAGIDKELPRNNLRLLVTPISPRQEWFSEARQRVNVARKAHELAESRWCLAYTLDKQDGGSRCDAANIERTRTRSELDQAVEDALRTPTTRKCDAAAKQDMIGKRVWAEKYRPDWQAMVDEDLTRYPSKSRKAGVQA